MSADDTLMPISEAGKTPQNYNVESGQAKFTKESESVDVQATTKLIGLTKEQLEQYRNDPFWKPVRYALFVLFWLVWLAMFIGAILIVVLSPKCAVKVEPKYYENLINYQIYTPTFRDSDNDGVGDLKGIQEKLNDLRKIGVNAIWPTPIVKANKDDYSPTEVMDIMEVDPRYGTADDLSALIAATHNAGLYFVIDLPLTVSVDNQWAKSIPGATIGDRTSNATLLNLGNERVQNKLVEAAQHYLKQGVDGIHLADYGFSKKVPRNSVKSVKPLIEKIRAAVASDPSVKQKDVLIFTEPAWSSSSSTDANSTENYRVLDLTEGSGTFLDRLSRNIEAGVKLTKDNSSVPPIWKLSDIDSPRIDQQLDQSLKDRPVEVASLLTLIQLFLPGPVNILYGEEIALPSNPPAQFPPQLGTMRWEKDSPNVGFSSYAGNKNFFVTADNATDSVFNVQYKDGYSALKAFKRLAELRSGDAVFQRGDFSFHKAGMHIYTRFMANSTSDNVYVLAVNWPLDNQAISRKLELTPEMVQGRELTKVEVKVPSAGNKNYYQNQDFNLEKEEIVLEPYQAIVVRVI